MKGLGNILTILGVVLVIYSIIGKFIGEPTIGFGLLSIKAVSGITMAIFLVVLGIAVKLWDK